MTITGYPFDSYNGTDASFEALLEQHARLDAEADYQAACERTVAPGQCTGCEEDAAELLPWGGGDRLCWSCTDIQLDLMAKAVGQLMVAA